MISIIGAGPSGNHLACLLSKYKDVNVYEEHSEIGKPVQCTGIVTSSIKNHIGLKKEFIVNKISKVLVVAPSKENIYLKLKNPNIILDRRIFDKHLAEKAIENGARYNLNTRFMDYSGNMIKLKAGNRVITRKTDLLIGADGSLSKVAKTAGLFNAREFVIGLQTRAKFKEIDKKTVKFFLGYGSFAWIVPESEYIARVGIVSKHNPKLFFKHFLKNINVKNMLEQSSGIIPVYNPRLKIQRKNVFLIGDAAAQVKATTYGGIIQGLIAAENLSKAVRTGNNYTMLCSKLNKELKYSLLLRKMMDRFTLKDYDDMMHLIQNKGTKKIIQSIDRDYPSKMIFKMIMSQPRLLRFAKTLLKHNQNLYINKS